MKNFKSLLDLNSNNIGAMVSIESVLKFISSMQLDKKEEDFIIGFLTEAHNSLSDNVLLLKEVGNE